RLKRTTLCVGSPYVHGPCLPASCGAWTGSSLAAVVLPIAATLLVGMLVEIVAMRRLYGRDHLDHVLGTFGLILFFNEAVRLIWGPAGLNLALPMWLNGAVQVIPGVYFPAYRLAIIVAALGVAAFLYVLVMRTRVGMLIRAGA